MEGHLQNPERTVRTMSYVLWTNQLPHDLPTNHEPHVQRNEDAIPVTAATLDCKAKSIVLPALKRSRDPSAYCEVEI